MSKHTKIKLPKPTEYVLITAAALQEPDAQPLTVEATIATWNDFNTRLGSFSDEHSTL